MFLHTNNFFQNQNLTNGYIAQNIDQVVWIKKAAILKTNKKSTILRVFLIDSMFNVQIKG